ncbi:MAG: 2,5-diamino-6-(ribosylamino)-4(3H)-pyrimidinone 5'-phosphate reductase [Anaerolineales bacterium]|nr:2,5-diamino-6-(ribosylamino)-4(3H)-pyrimidinone 5'-phosphate reductase [Anaerolineales bacterium]
MLRPYVLVNVAMTVDGKIDSAARRGATISSATDKRRVDELRASVDAVLVGGKTLLNESPKLTVRNPALRRERLERGLPENPMKVGVVSVANLDLDGDFVRAGPAERLIFTTRRTSPEQIVRLEKAGVQVFVSRGSERVDLGEMLETLHRLGVRRLLVEGGGTILAEFFRLGLVDELSIYLAPRLFGGATAPPLADGPGFLPNQAPRLTLVSVERFDPEGGILLRYLIPSPSTL